jgi:hypothetical protein
MDPFDDARNRALGPESVLARPLLVAGRPMYGGRTNPSRPSLI